MRSATIGLDDLNAGFDRLADRRRAAQVLVPTR